MYALRARDGHVNWTYHASGAVKGGPALVGTTLYFGDYAGRAYALNALNGHQIWAVGTNGTQFGFGSGNFYSTPAVAFGRVYLGNTDGRVYSFGARDGALAWATATGDYVYSSAAVQDTPGLGPTVYIGSYDGNFYAFNAQSGAIRWSHNAGGKISGSPTDRRQRRLLLGPRLQDERRPRRTYRTPGVLVPRRPVQPGDRRQQRDLPDRAPDDLPAPARCAPARGCAAGR